MKTIYIDVLIILNIYVNFFMLKASAKLSHTPLKTARCVAGSVIGSLFSLTILLPPLGFFLSLLLKLGSSVIITFIAFGASPAAVLLKQTVCFYITGFLFGGVIMLFYTLFRPDFMTLGNTYFYIDFSLISLVFFTAAAYAAVTGFRKLLDRGADKSYLLVIRHRGRSVSIKALADSGNSLTDVFSGRPVIICSRRELSEVLPLPAEPVPENAPLLCRDFGIRFIPYSTIGNRGMIGVFTPDEAGILDEESGEVKRTDAVIGINTRDVPAIFNPKLL